VGHAGTGTRGERLASFTHFLDIPILLVIVSLGMLRPACRTASPSGTWEYVLPINTTIDEARRESDRAYCGKHGLNNYGCAGYRVYAYRVLERRSHTR
jgi:hypothetical protein